MCIRDSVRLAEGLVLVGLAEQHFHGRHAAEAQRVEAVSYTHLLASPRARIEEAFHRMDRYVFNAK